MNPPLTHYLSLELGRNVKNTPDVWCYLRESVINVNGTPLTVKNFERWLYQRDESGLQCPRLRKVQIPDNMALYHPEHKYDYTARKTDIKNGNSAIGFAVDDRFCQAKRITAAAIK